MWLFNKTSKCPYCSFKFDKKPSRTNICNHCDKRFWIRKGRIVTEKDKRYLDLFQELSYYIPSLYKLEIKQMIEQGRSDNDIRWSFIQKKILDCRAKNDLQSLPWLYKRCAHIVKSENKDPEPYYQQGEKVIKNLYGPTGFFSCLTEQERQESIDLEISNLRQ